MIETIGKALFVLDFPVVGSTKASMNGSDDALVLMKPSLIDPAWLTLMQPIASLV